MSENKSKNTAVFGIYATPSLAETAVDHLLTRGFTHSSISVLLPDDDTTRAFAHEKHTKAPEGTATGVATGGVVGGTLGLLAGIGALAIPGVGPLIAAGPIMASLAGLGVGGAVGGFVGALVGMGIPEYEAKRYEGAVKGGGTLLSVHCDTSDQIDAAKLALKETGASDISSTGEAASKDTTGGRGTFGNISEGEPIHTHATDRVVTNRVVPERVVDDRNLDREVVATGSVVPNPNVIRDREIDRNTVVTRTPVDDTDLVDDRDAVTTTRTRY
jgi:hypothetical protein